MQIKSSVLAISGIREGLGKIFAILGRPSAKQYQYARGKIQGI
jgi:hypothetical protein